MKKIVKVWMLAVLLGGTAADLCAQTVWHDPAAERPQSAQRMQTATDGSQTATERYIRFITNAPSVEIRYQMAGTGGVRPWQGSCRSRWNGSVYDRLQRTAATVRRGLPVRRHTALDFPGADVSQYASGGE